MKYQQFIKDYYSNLYNLTELLKKMVDSYRLLIGGAAELNTINEAKTSCVKDAVKRADKLGDTIDHLIELIDDCGEVYFKYCSVVGEYVLKNSTDKVILTEVDNELYFQDSNNTQMPLREEIDKLKNYKEEIDEV